MGSTIPLRPSADEAVAPPPRTLGYSRARRFAQGVNLGLYPLVELRLLQSMTGPCRRSRRPKPKPRSERSPLMGFRAPSTHQPWRIHRTGAYLTPFVALPGFRTLSAPCSPPHLPALFHAGGVHGVSPFRAFSSRGAVPPLGGRCPPDVHCTPSVSPDSDRPRETGLRPLPAWSTHGCFVEASSRLPRPHGRGGPLAAGRSRRTCRPTPGDRCPDRLAWLAAPPPAEAGGGP